MLLYDAAAGRIEPLATLQRSPQLMSKMGRYIGDSTRSLFGKRPCTSSAATSSSLATAAAAAAAAAAAGDVSVGGDSKSRHGSMMSAASSAVPALSAVLPSVDGPVRCLFIRGGRAWACLGGKSSAWLLMWDVATFSDLDAWDCCTFGACNAMAAIRWPADDASGVPAHELRHSGGGDSNYRSQSNPPLATNSVALLAAAEAAYAGPWRLVTGHENGQLILWHPEQFLVPLLRIGDPFSPVRGIVTFDFLNLVVVGHHNGELRALVQPGSESLVPPGANSSSPQSFGTLRPRMVRCPVRAVAALLEGCRKGWGEERGFEGGRGGGGQGRDKRPRGRRRGARSHASAPGCRALRPGGLVRPAQATIHAVAFASPASCPPAPFVVIIPSAPVHVQRAHRGSWPHRSKAAESTRVAHRPHTPVSVCSFVRRSLCSVQATKSVHHLPQTTAPRASRRAARLSCPRGARR